jgi:hypothetical protein
MLLPAAVRGNTGGRPEQHAGFYEVTSGGVSSPLSFCLAIFLSLWKTKALLSKSLHNNAYQNINIM